MNFSVVIPCYKSPNTLDVLCSSLDTVFNSLNQSYEILLIDDNCPANSWGKIVEICSKNERIKGIKLSKNFGQHAAISCGLKQSQGDHVIVMDCDLQDDPALIAPMFTEFNKGFDVVRLKRVERKTPLLKKMESYLFYKFLSTFLGVKLDHQFGNYGIYSRKVVNEINRLKDRTHFLPYLVTWLGYNQSHIEAAQEKRAEGISSYTFLKSLKLGLDISISSSSRPIYFSIAVGAILSFLSFILALFYILKYFYLHIAPEGWTTLIVALLFSTGLILSFLGILGLYLIKIFEQTKQLPVFITDQKINL